MDTDNDNEQLNSSSTSSSNNSSSSNLLANLPMLPILQSTDNDGGVHFVQPEALPEPLDERIGAVGLPQPPSPSPPPPPTPPQQQHHTAGHLPDNSVFASTLLFNNNTTPPPSSSSSSSSPTSSSHNLQLYHHQQEPQQLQQEQTHSEHALHFEHSPSPSLQQHALLPPPPSPPPPLEQEQQQQQQQQPISEAAATAQHQQALEQQDIQEELQLTHPSDFVDNSPIADTIDASALESAASEAIGLNAEIASTSQQQQSQQQRQRLQQQEQSVESLSGAQRSTLSVIGEGAAGSSASNIRNQTPPISLPLLLQEEDDEDADADDEENFSGEQLVRAPKSPAALSYATHFTHHPFTHPLNHHHHHHYYPNFGGCINNSPFAFDIPALSGGGDSISISSNNNNNSGISFVSQINPSNGANTNTILTANMLGSSSNSDNPSGGGGGGATALSSTIAGAGGHSSSNHNHHSRQQVTDRLKMLYPNVNEAETPLPRCWSPHDKCLSIGLSQNNLHVHYKGE